MAPSMDIAEDTDGTTPDLIWDFLGKGTGNATASDLSLSMFESMKTESIPVELRDGFSPIFHEIYDHDQFFTDDYVLHDDKNIGAEQEAHMEFSPPNGSVDEIQDILLHSAGMSALRPTYDMLGIEPDSTDHPTPSSEGTWKNLDAPLELELVQIYFQTMHTLCPVINELDFYQWYHGRDRKKKNSPLRDLLLHVVIFAAFAHVDLEQLRQSPYSSVPDGQQTLFEHAHGRYNSLRDTYQGAVELVQSACILSHWSPYDSSIEVNCFWSDETIRHAVLGGLQLSNRPFHRVIWWCCLHRNRTLSLALRRPHKLKQYQPGRLPVLADFGDLWAPSPAVKSSRIFSATLFIFLCKLSVIMNEIVLLRHNNSRWDDWRAHSDVQGSTEPILDRIVAIDRSVVELKAAFESAIQELEDPKIHGRIRVSAHILHIMILGTRASLYEQYLDVSDGGSSFQWLLNNVAINKLKEASIAVVLQMRKVLECCEPQDVPLNLSAWLMIPIYVFMAQVKMSEGSQRSEAETSLEILLHLHLPLRERFTGIRLSAGVVAGLEKVFDKALQDRSGVEKEALELELLILGRRVFQDGMAIGVIVQG